MLSGPGYATAIDREEILHEVSIGNPDLSIEQHSVPTLVTPNPLLPRPLDKVASHGPPAEPIPFATPRLKRGRRDDVLVYIHDSRQHEVATNVLFRDFSVEYGDIDGGLGRVKQAYWPLPYKEKINTIMGHVEICVVLTRCTQDPSDDDGTVTDSEHSDDEGEIIFEMSTQYVAVKVNYCDRMDRYRIKQHSENPLTEIAAMQLIGNTHPNVIGVIDVLFDGANLNVVMPYCQSGDLFALLQQPGPGLSEGVARYWFRQMMAGLHHLHSRGICHRDLSPENVMIDHDNSLIIDLGMAIQIPYTDPSDPASVTDISRGTTKRLITPQGACGKLPYMSPEVYASQHPFDGAAVDIWTAGTILFCMLSGTPSYQVPNDNDPQFNWMVHALRRLVSDWGINLSEQVLHLLENMLQVDPRLRLTLDEVLLHPWMSLPDALPFLSHRPHDMSGIPERQEES